MVTESSFSEKGRIYSVSYGSVWCHDQINSLIVLHS